MLIKNTASVIANDRDITLWDVIFVVVVAIFLFKFYSRKLNYFFNNLFKYFILKSIRTWFDFFYFKIMLSLLYQLVIVDFNNSMLFIKNESI